VTSVNLTQLAPKAAILCDITRSDSHWAVQGHSRSPIMVPIESPYVTPVNNTNVNPISHRLRVVTFDGDDCRN